MNTRKVANQYRISHWHEILSERAVGESIDKFCERQGITRTQFFYWQRKLREAACTELSHQSESAAPQGWALAVQNTQAEQNQITIEINGCQIIVTQDTDAELLAKICRSLKNL